MFKKKCVCALVAAAMLTPCAPGYAADARAYAVTVDASRPGKPISPYIYGINGVPDKARVTITAARQGGNRMTGYNWENNYSNAGADWQHYSDTFLFPKGRDGTEPGIVTVDFAEAAQAAGAYALVTLPMAGYVANDDLKTVSEEDTAPSDRFARVVDRKDGELSLAPDLQDGVVYSDEYVHYLIDRLGDSQNGGVRGYSLDNEPALWPSTHPRIHPEKPTVAELIEKSVSLASVVKAQDAAAEVFGPALYGFGAYLNFQDAPDWAENYGGYAWFIDAYLEKMREAEEEKGQRLLDVLDLHYYTEARCPLGHRVSDDREDDEACFHTRMQSTRSLWDGAYTEDSWIGQWFSQFLPLLPKVRASIDTYYPGTKLSVTEYNFGYGDHISGGIAQADALGIFATHDVYLAALWPLSDKLDYAYAAFNLYTDYDGEGGMFGDNLVPSAIDDHENASVYAATDTDGRLHIVLLNKDQHNPGQFDISVNADAAYQSFAAYGFDGDSPQLRALGAGAVGESNRVAYELPPMTACHLVLTEDAYTADLPAEVPDADVPDTAALETARAEKRDEFVSQLSVASPDEPVTASVTTAAKARRLPTVLAALAIGAAVGLWLARRGKRS